MVTDHTDEKDLLLRLRNGDHTAFDVLYNTYRKRIARNLIKLLRDDEIAKDAYQELFIRVWNNRANLDINQPFKSYLFRIAENLVVDYYRKAARDQTMQERMMAISQQEYNHVEEQLFRKENIALLHSVIDKLPEQQRKAYLLHKIEGKSYREISELMGITPSTINKHIHQAHKFVTHQITNNPLVFQVVIATLLLNT